MSKHVTAVKRSFINVDIHTTDLRATFVTLQITMQSDETNTEIVLSSFSQQSVQTNVLMNFLFNLLLRNISIFSTQV